MFDNLKITLSDKPYNVTLRTVLLIIILSWIIIYSVPELLKDRIYPYDDALNASNGALIYTFFNEVNEFIKIPVKWFYDYYNQYPALSVRRYPPLFAFVEAGVFSLAGISVIGANLTILIFSLSLACALYLSSLKIWKNNIVAFLITLLVFTTPETMRLLRTIRLDIPALSFVAWAFYFYGNSLYRKGLSWNMLIPLLLFILLGLYTYQLVVFLVFGLFAHILIRKGFQIFKEKKLYIAFAIFVILLIPLMVQVVYFQRDSLVAISGSVEKEWARYTPVENNVSFEYWTYYANVLIQKYTIQSIGLILWLLLCIWRKPSTGEFLFVICVICAYLGFSWIPSKENRYANYIAFAASPLTILAIRDFFNLIFKNRHPRRRIIYIGFTLSILMYQALTFNLNMQYLEGVKKPVEHIISTNPNAKIFYAGPNDAAFVFYLRQADHTRDAKIYRASVQIDDPTKINEFLEENDIDHIVFEMNNVTPTHQIYIDFRNALNALLEDNKAFKKLQEFNLIYTNGDEKRPLGLIAYQRIIK